MQLNVPDLTIVSGKLIRPDRKNECLSFLIYAARVWFDKI